MIHVIATIELHEGRREAFLREFYQVMPKVHAEVGCLEYGPAVDLPTDVPRQVPAREDVVVLLEKWDSLDALKAHLAAPHMAEYRERVKGLVRKAELQILRRA